MSKYEYTVIQMVENAIRTVKAQPMFLGGVSGSGGGTGGPPGGFIGKLPQTKVTYDTTEAESTGIIGSGSLVDNLNHIRYRIKQLEVASGTASIDIYDDGVLVAQGVTILDFYDSLIATDLGSGHVRVDSTASGVASSGNITFLIQEDLTPFVNGIDTTFSTLYTIISGTLSIYYNGVRQEPIIHYTENETSFTTLFTPSGGVLLADYLTAVSGATLPLAGTTIVYSGTGYGDMLKSVYDTDDDGIVDAAESVPWAGITDKPTTFPPDSHTHTFLSLTDTPSNYTGFGGYVLSVKSDETGVEFTLVSGASGVTDHTQLTNLNSTDYYHLTQVEYTDLTDGGNTVLHSHTFSGGGHTIEDEGTPLPQRTYLNFIGSGVYAVDNPGADSTDVVISGGVSGSTVIRQVAFAVSGVLAVGNGTIRMANELGSTLVISKVVLHVNTAPTGAAIIVDVNKNGTTIFTTQANRPQIAASAFTGNTTSIDVSSWANGEYLQVDVDQVGSTIAGSDLTIFVICT